MSLPSINDMLKNGLQFGNWSAAPKAPSYSIKVKGAEWIEVRNFPVPIEVELVAAVPMTSGPMIMAKMQVSNRDNPGTMVWVQSQFVLGHAGGTVEKAMIGAAGAPRAQGLAAARAGRVFLRGRGASARPAPARSTSDEIRFQDEDLSGMIPGMRERVVELVERIEAVRNSLLDWDCSEITMRSYWLSARFEKLRAGLDKELRDIALGVARLGDDA